MAPEQPGDRTMNKSRIVFFLVVLGVVVSIARYNSRTTSPNAAAKPSATALPQATSHHLIPPPNASPVVTPTPSAVLAYAPAQGDLKKLAERITPSVLALSIFDASGKLLRNGTGFFVSDDGRFVTSRSIVDGGAHAVATASDGKIYNVNGILAESSPADVAVLKAQVKEKVHFISPSKMAPFEAGGTLAAIGSAAQRKENAIAQTAIAGRKSD